MLTVLRYPTEYPIKSALRIATGRSAVLHLARCWNPKIVFMPCYVPEGIIKPFQQFGADVVFYKLDAWLRPNFADLASKLEQHSERTRPVIVLIHYFGIRASIFEAQKLAAKYGGLVLSDCAHCVPFSDAYRHADVTLYSLNKFIAVSDGAIIWSRREDIDLSVSEDALPPLSSDALLSYAMHLADNRRIALADKESNIEMFAENSSGHYEDYYAKIDSDMTLRAQSSLSRAIEASTDFEVMRTLRSAKSRLLSRRLNPEFMVTTDERCEFAFPILCNGLKNEIATELFNAGIVASDLVDKWDFVPSGEGFDIESKFIHDHLLLPINEGVEMKDLLTMADVVNSFA